jgi:hypothetical protein
MQKHAFPAEIRPFCLFGIAKWPVCLILAVLIFCTGRVSGDTVTLTPVADTFISEAVRFPGPNGDGLDMVIGTQGVLSGTAKDRGLIKFDFSEIPTGATINVVRLQVTVNRAPTGSTPNSFNLHRMLRPWSEAESTWTLRLGGVNWVAPGAAAGSDYAQTVSGTTLIGGFGGYTFPSMPGIVADVAAWVADPSVNHGWLLKTADESISPSARGFDSRETATGPQLVVDFSPLFRIDAFEISNGEFCLRFNGKAGKSYLIERRERLDQGTWTQVTSLPPRLTDGPVTVCDGLTPISGFYRVQEF